MSSEIQYYNSIEAAQILGVNVSTVKRWTDEGRLECVKTIGGHRKFVMGQLTRFLDQNRGKTSRLSFFPIGRSSSATLNQHIIKGNFEFLTGYIRKNALSGNRSQIQLILNGLYLSQFPLHVIYDQLLTPVLHEIGSLWKDSRITVAEEHLATHSIRDAVERLQGLIEIAKPNRERVLCLNLSNELHDLALKMVDHILELRGFMVYYTGSSTPAISVANLIRSFQPRRIYIGSTFVENVAESQSEFNQICEWSTENNCGIYVGGPGFDQLNINHPAVIRRLNTFEDVYLN